MNASHDWQREGPVHFPCAPKARMGGQAGGLKTKNVLHTTFTQDYPVRIANVPAMCGNCIYEYSMKKV